MPNHRAFRVVNFEKFQHYKNRNPPWIKLYNTILDTYDFGNLKDQTKGHLILIWLLASRHDNQLPWDARWIGERIQSKSKVDLEEMQMAGFIEQVDDASNMLAQDASNMLPLEREERENIKKREIPPIVPPQGDDAFEQFWKEYPSPKSGQIKAREAWEKRRNDPRPAYRLPPLVVILAALDRFKTSQRCADGFVCAPTVWLNQGRWNDDLPLERDAAFLARHTPQENGHGRTIDTTGFFSDQNADGGVVPAEADGG